MLDLRKIESNYGFDIESISCNWYLSGEWIGNDLTYSAGPKYTDHLEVNVPYSFKLITKEEGLVCSTSKMYGNDNGESVLAYPNPVVSGNLLTVEGVATGSPIEVFTQTGVRIIHTIATDPSTKLSLHVPAGIYIVRTTNGDVKIVVE
jgi:hypothetical protein